MIKFKDKKIDINKNRKWKVVRCMSESSFDFSELVLCDIFDEEDKENEVDNCVGCGENYYKICFVEEWFQCFICDRWVYENCIEFDVICVLNVDRRRKKKLNKLNFREREREKES